MTRSNRLVCGAILVAVLASPAVARQQLPPGCGGRFLVRELPLTAGKTQDLVFVVGSAAVAIDALCPPARATVRRSKHGTSLRVVWSWCPGLGARGRTQIKATLDGDCGHLDGVLVSRKSKLRRQFAAERSTCGDGIVDPAADEQCDGGGCGPNERCAACVCVPAPTSSTIARTPTTSTSTSSTTLPPDFLAPALVTLSVSPTSVDTSAGPASVTVHVEAQDDVTGFGAAGPNGSLTALNVQGFPQVVRDSLPLSFGSTSLHGVFDFAITFPRFSRPGTYAISMTLTDRASNTASYSRTDLAALGLPSVVTALPFATPDATTYGHWGPVTPWPKVAIHLNVLPSGQVMFWDTDSNPQLWDPAGGMFSELTPPGYDIFCSGYSFLADGRLFVTGGNLADGEGLPAAAIYDPVADHWTTEPDMNAGRWYPTNTTLANGDVLTVAGSYWDGTLEPDGKQHIVDNMLPQVFQVGSGTWRDLTGSVFDLPLYPFMYLLPSGQVFAAGWMPKTRLIDTTGTGAMLTVGLNTFGNRDRGSSAMYDDARVMMFGGSPHTDSLPTDTTEVIDLNAPSPAWRATAPMARPRRHVTGTLLPDGSVLATGGTSAAGFNDAQGSELTAELWDPTSETWATMAPMQTPRLYHSTAALLPDATVVVAGGGHPSDDTHGDTTHFDAEIYSPPYLFRGPRPVISSAPATVAYGQGFLVGTPDPAGVAQVTWLRLGSVTHSFNQNQRINRLTFSRVANGVQVSAPSDPNRCPPGHYILFLLDASGVPSVGKIVRIGS